MYGGELRLDGFIRGKDAGEWGGVRFANGFAVPACAFGVEFVKHFLIRFARPFEGGGEGGLVDFVVVVDEFACFEEGVGVVG